MIILLNSCIIKKLIAKCSDLRLLLKDAKILCYEERSNRKTGKRYCLYYFKDTFLQGTFGREFTIIF